jgi:hypothetical protein
MTKYNNVAKNVQTCDITKQKFGPFCNIHNLTKQTCCSFMHN